jgi:hypothetical protein
MEFSELEDEWHPTELHPLFDYSFQDYLKYCGSNGHIWSATQRAENKGVDVEGV